MEQDLCNYMSLQVNEIEKILKNMKKERSAILANDRRHMKNILIERGSILEEIQSLRNKIDMEISRVDIDGFDEKRNAVLRHRHQEIKQLLNEINTCNNRNKFLLELRLRGS